MRKFIILVLQKAMRLCGKLLRSPFLRTAPTHDERQAAHQRKLARFQENARNGRLIGKVAIVTGGAGGIGRATSILFAREGAKVVVADLNNNKEIIDEITAAGGEAIFVQTDVTSDEQVRAMVAQTIVRFGRLDIIVINAGANFVGEVVTMPPETWQRGIDINLNSAYRCCHHGIPHLRTAGGGSIVMTASITGHRGVMDSAVYAAAKAGMLGLTRQIARQYAGSGIRANTVSPGVIKTAMFDASDYPEEKARIVSEYTPLGFLGLPEDIAHAILFLASEESAYITGIDIIADGGITMRGT